MPKKINNIDPSKEKESKCLKYLNTLSNTSLFKKELNNLKRRAKRYLARPSDFDFYFEQGLHTTLILFQSEPNELDEDIKENIIFTIEDRFLPYNLEKLSPEEQAKWPKYLVYHINEAEKAYTEFLENELKYCKSLNIIT